MLKTLKSKYFAAFLVLFFAASPQLAMAGEEAATIQGVLCNAYGLFNGPIGRSLAIFAVVALGVAFFLGKVSWGTAIAIALGIGAMFGAPTIVSTITGGTVGTTCADVVGGITANPTTPGR